MPSLSEVWLNCLLWQVPINIIVTARLPFYTKSSLQQAIAGVLAVINL